MLIHQHVSRWYTIFDILSFCNIALEMFVLLRFGIVSLGDRCPMFQTEQWSDLQMSSAKLSGNIGNKMRRIEISFL
jgi:hypothetical protein